MRELPRRERLGDVAALVCTAAGGALGVSTDVLPGGVDPLEGLGLALGAGALVAIFWRRRAPVLFAVGALLLGTWTPLAGFVGLVGVYTVAVYRTRLVAVWVTAFALVVSAVDLWFDVPDPVEFRWVAGVVLGLTLAAAGWGLFVGARRELMASLWERAERAEADLAQRAERARAAERARIAREMHDVLGHRLSLLSVHAGALELRGDLPAADVRRTAGVLRETATAALDDLRGILLVLREEGPGADAPQPRLADVPDLVTQSRTAGVAVELTHDVPGAPPDQLGRTAYRIVQEGLTNARRHAAGAPVHVEVAGRPGAELSVRVVSGPGGAGPDRGSGTGLIGLRERVALAGGELADAVDDTGRHVLTARMPWPT
ncbi:histidine kinase [Pseudonocardia petroleophila]|uniref:histidine kinase n=1 Tax=Pseudonocardia petroleophila TaxID=37331 RepID=A0A7G7MPN9_9PSEU|nr:histidine kinase [Pseudonocardia petroleophila]QNG54750.1 sensor histidine kinase [Pseudonocardia petroleophila]